MKEYTFILGALDEEIDGIRAAMESVAEKKAGAFPVWCGKLHGKDILLCRCGVGKTNAAAAVSATLTAFAGAARVINTGVAGGIGGGVRRGDVVVGTRTVQHDFDQTPDGLRKGQVQGFDSEYFDADARLVTDMEQALRQENIAYRKGIIASGDQFIADGKKAAQIADTFGAIACEMESASAAQVCALYGVPFLALRAISDDGGEQAVSGFYEFLCAAAANNARAVCRFVKNL